MRQPRLSDDDLARIRDALAGLIESRLADFAELAALRAELLAANRERDEWRRQAQLLADRRAELVEEVRRESALKPRLSTTGGAAE